MQSRRSGMRPAIRIIIILLLSWGLTSIAYGIAASQERAEIIEKAKKEGVVALYTSVNFNDLNEINPAFERKFPFLKVNTFRLGSARLFAKAQAEYRAGQYLADNFGSSFWALQEFFEGGLLGTYKSPERETIPESAKDKEGYWTCDYINIGILAYNTALVPPNKVPKSYRDLLDPWWKGKIGLDDTGFRWYSVMLEILGREKGRVFMQKLAQQNIGIRRGQTLLVQLLGAGEFAAVINIYNADVEALKKKGAPVEWVAPLDQPTIMTPHVIAMAKYPPHPNAAKLYIDFLLSKEGQQIMPKLNNISARADVPPNPPRMVLGADGQRLKFFPVDLEIAKKANLHQKEFRELFISHGGK